mmetsp:Transcript_14014/g.33059  ORF Transcript_14014/g.33059 Transcript_14014/m.33059 type:complete len:210 (-) Transcript_14014:3-632(-)
MARCCLRGCAHAAAPAPTWRPRSPPSRRRGEAGRRGEGGVVPPEGSLPHPAAPRPCHPRHCLRWARAARRGWVSRGSAATTASRRTCGAWGSVSSPCCTATSPSIAATLQPTGVRAACSMRSTAARAPCAPSPASTRFHNQSPPSRAAARRALRLVRSSRRPRPRCSTVASASTPRVGPRSTRSCRAAGSMRTATPALCAPGPGHPCLR